MQRKSKTFSKKDKKKVVVDWILRASDPNSQRRALAEEWLEETRYTDYRYNVETCEDGRKIYLLRPTWLNKGFDFQVNVEGFRSEIRNAKGLTIEMPAHPDIFQDLRTKLGERPGLKEDLFAAICRVYDCVEPSTVMEQLPQLRKLKRGLATDKLLRILKWLFIEQDLTYWLHTGRNKLMSAIETEAFGIDAPLKK